MEKYGANLIAEKEFKLQELRKQRQHVYDSNGGIEKVSQLTTLDKQIKEITEELEKHKS